MAGVSTEQGSNKLDVELNLVPFIDLLSTLVLFLLVTAVWLQISALPASVRSKGKSVASQTNERRLTIQVTPNALQLGWPNRMKGPLPKSIGKIRGDYDFSALSAALERAGKLAKLPAVAVSAVSGVSYGSVVQAIDAAKSGGAPSVALSTE